MKNLQRLALALGLILQAIIVESEWPEFGPILRGELPPPDLKNAVLFLSPVILGIGGAAWAGWLYSRGSRWAWVVVMVPLILLSLTLLFAVLLWVNPIRHQP